MWQPEEGEGSSGQALKLPSAPAHGSINKTPEHSFSPPTLRAFAGLSVRGAR